MKDSSARYHAIRITLLYLVTASAWILFSDRLLNYLVVEGNRNLMFQTLKGWAFVLITGALLYVERRISAERLERSEKKFFRFLDQTIDGVFLTDRDGRVIFWNSSMQNIAGIPAAETIGEDLGDVLIRMGEKAQGGEDVVHIRDFLREIRLSGKNTFLMEEKVFPG
ncbi:MAG TPA: PAS domain-containing protein, partial [Spirochaetota bacterium]